MKENFSQETTKFLDNLNHPQRELIEALRCLILENTLLYENIKWNAPNYVYSDTDIITMKLFPSKHVQIILHQGAKLKEQPKERPLSNTYHILEWKSNDRAVITLTSMNDFNENVDMLRSIFRDWIKFIQSQIVPLNLDNEIPN